MRGLYTNQKRSIEHFARMLCSCFFSYSYSYSVRRGGLSTSTSTSTTKSQARHEPKDILAQPFAYGPNSRLGSIRNSDLAQDMLDVLFDRFVTDRQIIGDLSIGHTTG